MDKLRQDIGYALRTMRRNPLVTAVIVLTLAIGIGSSAAIFTLVDAVLLRDLPYRDPDRLVAVWLRLNSEPDAKAFATYRDFLEIREHAESFEDVAANTWAFAGQTLMWRGEPHRVLAIPSTENLFSLLGASAARGRTFAPGDLTANARDRNQDGARRGSPPRASLDHGGGPRARRGRRRVGARHVGVSRAPHRKDSLRR